MSILDLAQMGKFFSDCSVQKYCEQVWHPNPVTIKLQFSSQNSVKSKV
jgi:hypothetical protein